VPSTVSFTPAELGVLPVELPDLDPYLYLWFGRLPNESAGSGTTTGTVVVVRPRGRGPQP